MKKLVRFFMKISLIPFLPIMALGWWAASDDSYWEAVKGVWRV